MVEFIHGVVALLAGLILVLTALVGWLYLQQSRMSHAINALAVAVTAPPPSFMYSSQMPPEQEEPLHKEDDHDDDRLSVHDLDAAADAAASQRTYHEVQMTQINKHNTASRRDYRRYSVCVCGCVCGTL